MVDFKNWVLIANLFFFFPNRLFHFPLALHTPVCERVLLQLALCTAEENFIEETQLRGSHKMLHDGIQITIFPQTNPFSNLNDEFYMKFVALWLSFRRRVINILVLTCCSFLPLCNKSVSDLPPLSFFALSVAGEPKLGRSPDVSL